MKRFTSVRDGLLVLVVLAAAVTLSATPADASGIDWGRIFSMILG